LSWKENTVATKPEAAEAAEPVKAPAGNKKLLLIIVVAVLVLGLAGGAGWVFLGKKGAALDAGEDGAEDVAQAEHEAPHGPPTYLPLDNMVVNLADPGGDKVAQVGVTLELVDAKAPEKVRAYLPSIRNGILMLVSQRTSEELLQREGKEKLAADILTDASRYFAGEGQGKTAGAKAKKGKSAAKGDEEENPVRGVLFSSFIVQ
jgi:flagellar protein FliL